MIATTWVQIIKAVLLVSLRLLVDPGVGAVRLLAAGVPAGRRGRSQGPGPCGGAAGRGVEEHDATGTRPALPRAGPALQGAARPDLARHGPGVRHRRHAAHPDALLHRADRPGRTEVRYHRDVHHRRLLRPDHAARLRRRHPRRPSGDRRGRPGRQHGHPAARPAPRWRCGFDPRRHLPGLPLRGRLRHDPGGCFRPGSGRCLRHRPRHLRQRDQGARDAAGAGPGRPYRVAGRRCRGIIIGIAAEGQNVAHLVALAFAVASSGNLPFVLLSLFWRKFNTAGVISGLVVGTLLPSAW